MSESRNKGRSESNGIDYESIRNAFRPRHIRTLFVGESRPASGGFFYVSSPMTGYMQRVFSSVFSRTFCSQEEFLKFFKSTGFYLDDISRGPVDKVHSSVRRKLVTAGIEDLSQRIGTYQPERVIAVLKRIKPDVIKAAQLANFPGHVMAVPFPGQSHQTSFVRELSAILEPIYKRK